MDNFIHTNLKINVNKLSTHCCLVWFKVKVMFGFWKILRKEKNVKENDFFMFGCPMKNIKENQIWLKLIKNLCIFKLFNFYIDE